MQELNLKRRNHQAVCAKETSAWETILLLAGKKSQVSKRSCRQQEDKPGQGNHPSASRNISPVVFNIIQQL